MNSIKVGSKFILKSTDDLDFGMELQDAVTGNRYSVIDKNGIKMMKRIRDNAIFVPSMFTGEYFTLVSRPLVLNPNKIWDPSPTYTSEHKVDLNVHKRLMGDFQSITEPKCTCGIDAIGGGLHSDWCDKK